jgi:hypothetical protein
VECLKLLGNAISRKNCRQIEFNSPPIQNDEDLPMDVQTFQSELNRAKTKQLIAKDPIEADYWDGYQRGLRRLFYGERFGTARQHAQWLSFSNDANPSTAARGGGYRDGLRFGEGMPATT